MHNINMIARDINVEVNSQGEKLLTVDKTMGNAQKNTGGALKEL